MIFNHLKIAWRNIQKNKGLTLINLIGLATGFAIALLIIQYVLFEKSYENTVPNADNIVRLTLDLMNGTSVTTQDVEIYPSVGAKLQAEVSAVTAYTRVYPIGEPNTVLKVGEKQFIAKDVFAVDPAYFTMFDQKLIHGSAQNIFKKPNELILTKSLALAYFNTENVVGQTILSPGRNGDILYTIVGVIADSPINTHLKIEALISYATMITDPEMQRRHGEKAGESWQNNNTYTYVKLAPHTDYNNFTKALASFSQRLIDEQKIKSERIIGQKIKDIHLYSKKTFEPDQNGDIVAVLLLLGVAFLVLLSAFVNYSNLTTSKAMDRAKEVGIKKVIGAEKNQLRIQFLMESFLISLLAALLAIVFIAFAKTSFSRIANLSENFAIFSNLSFWILTIIFILLGTFLSGLYPAFVLSSFKPLAVLKGNYAKGTQGTLTRKMLVLAQITITIILLIGTFTVKEQLEFMRSLDKGANVDNSIVIDAPAQKANQDNYSSFKQNLLNNPAIKAVSIAHTVPGQDAGALSTTTGIKISGVTQDNHHNFYITFADDNYLPLMEVTFLAGTNFSTTSTQAKREVVVNQEALSRWNIASPMEAIGKKLLFWNTEWTIIGVVKNYHQESPKAPYLPTLHLYNNVFRSLAIIQFNGVNTSDQISFVKQQYNASFAGAPFSYFFMDKAYDKQFREDERFQNLFLILTIFSILIACLGLIGLTYFSISKRKKEIGVRKVIGARTNDILLLLSKDYLKILSIATLISIPISIVLLSDWLASFAFKITLQWWLFAIPVLVVIALILISIGIVTLKAATANPVNSLRTE